MVVVTSTSAIVHLDLRFLSAEMEKESMINEDVASFLRDRWSERQTAESRYRLIFDRLRLLRQLAPNDERFAFDPDCKTKSAGSMVFR